MIVHLKDEALPSIAHCVPRSGIVERRGRKCKERCVLRSNGSSYCRYDVTSILPSVLALAELDPERRIVTAFEGTSEGALNSFLGVIFGGLSGRSFSDISPQRSVHPPVYFAVYLSSERCIFGHGSLTVQSTYVWASWMVPLGPHQ